MIGHAEIGGDAHLFEAKQTPPPLSEKPETPRNRIVRESGHVKERAAIDCVMSPAPKAAERLVEHLSRPLPCSYSGFIRCTFRSHPMQLLIAEASSPR